MSSCRTPRILHCMSSLYFRSSYHAHTLSFLCEHKLVTMPALPMQPLLLLSGHEKQPNSTEFQASMHNPNQASSSLLPTVSHRTQDGRSSNSPDANLIIPSAKVRGRILGLAATPIELVHISNHHCSTTELQEGSYQKKVSLHTYK